jgi:hypothetical protein
MSPSLRRHLLTLGLAAVALPGSAGAQLREIVTKTVSASASGASLELGLANDASLLVRLEDGEIIIDERVIGSYQAGDALDRAWRSLLGEAMTLEDGALAERLVGWSPSLSGAVADAAREIDDALERTLQTTRPAADPAPPRQTVAEGSGSSLARLLVRSIGRLGGLQEALSGLGEDFDVHVDEDVTVSRNEIVDGSLLVIGGTLTVEGRITGDAVVVGGALDVRDDGHIEGQVRLADTRVLRDNGEIGGGIIDLLDERRVVEAELRDRLRDEIRAELRSDLRSELRDVTRGRDGETYSIMAPLRPIIRGVGGVLETLVLLFVLGLVGAGVFTFAGQNVDTIVEAARRAPGRAALVGFAGTFLLLPAWVLGVVLLAVSIVGIPLAIAWIPLFPLAAMLAALVGYIAVARVAGERLADSGYPWTAWIRKSNPILTLVGGLAALLMSFVASDVISIAPFLGPLSGLLFALGVLITVFAVQVGFGAVLLTRAGHRPEYAHAFAADAAWEAAMEAEMDLEEEPASHRPGGDER